MCKATEQGYHLRSSDRIITSADLDTLTGEEVSELLQAPVTAWEMLHLRKQNHHIINSLSAHIMEEAMEFSEIKETLSEIKSSLVVKVKNGTIHEKNIGELVVDLYALHSKDRRNIQLKELLSFHKVKIIIITLCLMVLSIIFHHQINKGLELFKGYIVPILGVGIVAPIIVILLTNLFKKGVVK